MNELALFAGGGGGLYAGRLLGHTPVCAVEIDPACRRMLLQRQADGIFPRFPIWDDVRTFDGRPWRGTVDIVSGGFPCQDISTAGSGAGLDGARSGLWVEMARIIREVRPRIAFVENSPALTARGLGRVLADLAKMGFDARWGVLGAAHLGAPHRRDRIWIVANDRSQRREGTQRCGAYRAPRAEAAGRCDAVADANGLREQQPQGREQDQRGRPGDGSPALPDAECTRFQGRAGCGDDGQWRTPQQPAGHDQSDRWPWPPEPGVCRVVDGVANWKHRIAALGNGQVPRVAAAAWRLLSGPQP